MELQGKVAIVTGGASGIGLEMVKHLLQAGLKGVAILDMAEAVGKAAVSPMESEFGGKRAIFIRADVTKADQFKEAFKKASTTFGGLDIVINNAGVLNEDNWELTIAVNVAAVMRGTLLALEAMGRDRGGRGGAVLNVASILGLSAIAGAPAYVTSKHAVVGLVRSFGMPYHWERTGVRVMALCPGVTETPLVAGAGGPQMSSMGQLAAQELAELPQQKPDAVARAAVEVLRRGESGSLWVSEGGQPAYRVVIPAREQMRV
ncbi:15-hydroxyprostaglandin dehydrogenase [NAD(+)]-like isoform X2 [Schistocerca serialis cubense]|uniref:15-hydroxyprostaglandin dehydrogenase [NAD(+)]-like isoform X1 n=1 Tax=Schistocerca serialis cubense TaxID=2023355 RepID=UPI00214F60EB|nr:15-hydroxyprostaglandin dehydrogenase [NAD(+)]-like isoform X1 [Schistocerca serialis cubense]XP_049938364.1 15-hydroxyprostaglandin dehydrogenase [NAD(+)]-like isoform X2 [Schistocerca serialis cubense]